jgi:hypothetical protein
VDYLSYDDLPHLEGVELGTAGMEWPASTGPFTLTMEHIADVVTAANDDPHVVVPRVKLGHTSTINGVAQTVDPFRDLGDAAPVFGRIINLRTTNEGAVLLGDYVDVPRWLAEGMPSLFPNRSGEWYPDVTTEGGKHYSMVLAAVACLGAFGPGITDLEDLVRLATEGPTIDPAQSAGARSTVPPSQPASHTSVSVGVIRDRFNFEWATNEESFPGVDTYWWWARDIRVDPPEIIVDDDEGGLWRVPFTTDGEDNVEFDTPVRVRETFVDLPASAQPDAVQTAAPISSGQRVLASNLGRPQKDDRVPAATRSSNANDPQEDHTVDPAEERSLLGLAEDATDEEVAARRAQIADLPDPQPTTDDPEPDEDPEHEPEEPGAEVEPEPVAASADTVTVSRQVWDETNQRLERVETSETQRAARETAERRDNLADGWVRAGQIAPSERDHYRSMLDVDEERTTELAASLAPGRVPVDERGAAPDPESADLTNHATVMASFGVTGKEG